MANVNNKPFITYILDQIINFNITEVVICTGYLAHKIKNFVGSDYKSLSIKYSHEEEPLGTAGAIRNAKRFINNNLCLVLNGDSYIDYNIDLLNEEHFKKESKITIVVKSIKSSERYGAISLNNNNEIIEFVEKGSRLNNTLINTGVYLMNKEVVKTIPKKNPFSLEYEFLPTLIGEKLFAYESKGKFIDIGTPKSFKEAQSFFKDLN